MQMQWVNIQGLHIGQFDESGFLTIMLIWLVPAYSLYSFMSAHVWEAVFSPGQLENSRFDGCI